MAGYDSRALVAATVGGAGSIFFFSSPSTSLIRGIQCGVGSTRAVVNKFSDAIQCCSEITDDSWQKHHDAVKKHIITEVTLARVPVD